MKKTELPKHRIPILENAILLAHKVLSTARISSDSWEQETYRMVLAGNLALVLRNAEAASLLRSNGYLAQTYPLGRAVFEAWLDMHFLSRDWQSRILDYLRFDPAESLKLGKALGRVRDHDMSQKKINQRVRFFEKLITEMGGDIEKLDEFRTWSKMDYASMARELECEDLHRVFYKPASWRTHPSALALRDYIRVGHDGLLYVAFEATQSDNKPLLEMVAALVLHLCELFASEVGAKDLEAEVTRALADHLSSIRKPAKKSHVQKKESTTRSHTR